MNSIYAPSLPSINDSIITEKRVSHKHNLLEELREWSQDATAHGILPIINTKSNVFRLIWFVCLIGAIGMCSYMSYRCVNQYLQYGVVTTIYTYDAPELVFPAVSVCNLNPFLSPSAFRYLRDYYNQKFNVSIETFLDFANLVKDNTVQYETDWIFYHTYDPDFNKTLLQSFGYNSSRLIANCLINGQPCKQTDFVWYYDSLYGNCFRFNSGVDANNNSVPLYTIDREGNGLIMQIFSGLDDSEFPYMYESPSKAIVLLINDQSTFPIKQNGVLNPADYASIAISRTETQSLSAPYVDCQSADNVQTLIGAELKKLGLQYSRTNCMTMCEQWQTILAVGCYDMTMPQMLGARPCRTQEEYNLLNNLLFNYTMCYEHCPYECDLITFDVAASFADFPSYNYYLNETLLRRAYYENVFETTNITYDQFVQSVGKVEIYFPDLTYTFVQTSPSYEVMDIFANVGGTMGLFLGVSLLSFVEFVELFFTFLRIYIRGRRQKIAWEKETKAYFATKKAEFKEPPSPADPRGRRNTTAPISVIYS